MELLADGPGLLGNGLVAFVLGLLVYMGRVDRNWMRESLKEQREALKELGEKVDRNAAEAKAEREKGFAEAKAEREKGFAEAKAEREKGFAEAKAEREKGLEEAKAERENLSEKVDRNAAEAKAERENLRILLSQVAERTARIEGRQQGRAETLLERRLQELVEEHGVASSAAAG